MMGTNAAGAAAQASGPSPSADSSQALLTALGRVIDPELRRPITALGMVRSARLDGGQAKVDLALTVAWCPMADRIERDVREAVASVEGVTEVDVEVGVMSDEERQALFDRVRGGRHNRFGPDNTLTRVIAVGSGKGGVGKSTLTSNLAVALARAGRRVGLLDADIYGPSQPRMLGLTGQKPISDGQMIEPLRAHGVTVMSLGLMMKEGEAVVWRGPMLMGALQQMLNQVKWGELDVLLVDLPPGTGDVQLSLCQKAQVSGAIIVSTPQDVALIDARRAIDMFNKLKTPVLGLVENMSTYICPNCGHEAHLFGHGGVATEAQQLGLPFLGEIPLDLEVRLAGDAGTPVAATEGPVADAFARLAARLIDGGMA